MFYYILFVVPVRYYSFQPSLPPIVVPNISCNLKKENFLNADGGK